MSYCVDRFDDALDLVLQEFDGALDVDFFNASEIEQLIKSVEARNQDGVVQGNVRLLLRMLSNEVNQQGAASAQRQLQMAVSWQCSCRPIGVQTV